MIQFDESNHTYTLNGERVPSVTQILHRFSEEIYRFVDSDLMERAARLGTAVHEMIRLDCAGVLDEAGLHEKLQPYFKQWREFLAQSGFEPTLSEQFVWSEKYRFAGQLDLFGTLNGKPALIDAKRCASVPFTAGPQTAGYELALAECNPQTDEPVQRFALQLVPNERWKLLPMDGTDDRRVFMSALTIHNYLETQKAA